MNSTGLRFKMATFVIAAVAITLVIGGGMYALLRQVRAEDAARIQRVLAAKNAAYQLLETIVSAQSTLQDSLRLKDPDEIEKGLESFKQRLAAARQLIKTTAGLPPAIAEKTDALAAADQRAIDQFLLGENSAAYEIMLTVAPPCFDALLQVIRSHSVDAEKTVVAETALAEAALTRTVRWAAIGCAVLVLLLTAYGRHFSHATTVQLRTLANSLSDASSQVADAATQVSESSQTLA